MLVRSEPHPARSQRVQRPLRVRGWQPPQRQPAGRRALSAGGFQQFVKFTNEQFIELLHLDANRKPA